MHSVRAVSKVLGHLEQALPPERGRVVLHWFTGSAAEAKRAVAYGCYFSINAAMLHSAKHRQLTSNLPIERLLTETDGPFVQHGDKGARPRDVAITVAELAKLRAMPSSQMAEIIVRNLDTLVRS